MYGVRNYSPKNSCLKDQVFENQNDMFCWCWLVFFLKKLFLLCKNSDMMAAALSMYYKSAPCMFSKPASCVILFQDGFGCYVLVLVF